MIGRKNKNQLRKGLTLLEMVISIAIMVIIIAVFAPQLKTINDSWASKQANAEVLQNARVLVDQINRSLSSADRVTGVSDLCEIDGYIEFQDNTGTAYRIDIAANNYIEYGPVGSLSDMAGPVSQLRFTCYSKDDFTTPTTVAEDIRFVKAEVIFTNPGPGQDRTFTTSTYLRTNASATVGIWKLDETSGLIANDSSGNDYHGNLRNMAGDEWTSGQVDGALGLEGSDDYIEVTGLLGEPANITICAWVNLTSADTLGAEVVSLGGNVLLRLDTPGFSEASFGSYCTGGFNWVNTFTGEYVAGTGWRHVAYVIDDTNDSQKYYIDGVEVGSSNYTQSISYSDWGTTTVMGKHIYLSGFRFDGIIDDIRIYNRALTPAEIADFVADFSITPGTPFRFESMRTVQTPVLSKIDDTHYLCAYDTTSDGWGTVLVVDTDAMTVTEETDYAITATGGMNPSLNQIDSTRYLYGHSDQSPEDDGWARVLQVNTSTWAITAAANYEYDTSYGIDQSIEQIDSTHYLCTYDGPGDEVLAVVLTVNTSDWTVTAGTPTVIDDGVKTSLEKIDDTHYFCAYFGGSKNRWGRAIVLEVDTSSWTVSLAGPKKYGTRSRGVVLEPYDDTHIMSLFHSSGDTGWSCVFNINTGTWSISQNSKYQILSDIESIDLDRIFGNYYLYAAGNPTTSTGEAMVIELDPSTYLTSEKVALTDFGSDVNNLDVVQIDVNYYLCVYNDSGGDGWAVIINVNAVSAPSGDVIMP